MSENVLSEGGLESQAENLAAAEESAAPRSVTLPADENDAEGWSRLYKELGRPDSPEGYGLAEFLEGRELDPQFAGVMGAAMFGAGLSKTQARTIASAYQQEWQSAMAASEAHYESEKAEVMKSFAPGQIEAARRAFRASGVPKEVAESIERGIGPRAAVELFSKFGELMREDRPARHAEGTGGASSPEAVRRRIDQLMADSDFRRRYQRGEESAVREMEALSKRAVMA